MSMHLLASTGLFTGILEAVATAIGAGLVVGGFAAGIEGVASRRSRQEAERNATFGGYVGGLTGLALLALDTLGKRFV
jgi:hypothetical protein